MSGVHTCNAPLIGNYIGVARSGTDYFSWHEIRAYEMIPLALTGSMLSTNSMPNVTLVNALSLSMALGQTLGLDSVFTATGAGVYWMVNLSYITKIKAVIIMGELTADGLAYTANGVGWSLTFGNSASPCTNPSLYT